MSNTLDELEDLVTNYNSTVDRWLRKGRTIGEAYAEASREAGVKIQAHTQKEVNKTLDNLTHEMEHNITFYSDEHDHGWLDNNQVLEAIKKAKQ